MATKNIHEVLEGIQEQSTAESVSYIVNTLPWGGTPTNPVIDIFDEEDLTTSLSSTHLTGSATVNGDNVATKVVGSLVEDVIYRMTVQFVSNGNTLQGYVRIQGVF